MASSLTPQVAMQLVEKNNGGTAQKIIRFGLDAEIIRSSGRSRIAGQVGAFVKMYNAGHLPQVYRDEKHRPYKYYLKGSIPVEQSDKLVSEPVTFRPTTEQEKILTALTETKTFPSRSEAIIWLLQQGITANEEYIRKIKDAYSKIEEQMQIAQRIVKEVLKSHSQRGGGNGS
jgi:hypothetical protein